MSGAVRKEAPPLAAASVRLRGRPGRPRKLHPDSAGRRSLVSVASVAPVAPRLLDLAGASLYLGLRERKIRQLVTAGVLRRVRIPEPNGGEVRRVLLDRLDLDSLIESWREDTTT